MRRPLFLFMIALLLLRGWAGEAMATDMATGQAQRTQQVQHAKKISNAIETIALSSDTALASGHFYTESTPAAPSAEDAVKTAGSDCAGHGEALTVELEDSTGFEGGSEHCDTCPACQACHTIALSLNLFSTATDSLPLALPNAPTAQFASAFAALGQKPPIS